MELQQSIVSHLLPDEIYQHFSAVSIEEHSYGIELRLEESAELVPSEIDIKADAVLDGFCNPLELLHFSLRGKPLYLNLYRRRWKVSGSNKHYGLHPRGVKATHEFASFLKGEARCPPDEYIRFLPGTEP